MDGNYWRMAQAQGQAPAGDATAPAPVAANGAVETGDWRAQLQPESREMIVNKIMETLKRHIPFAGPEGLYELWKIAVRFEEKIYAAAVSESDYLRKVSLKMLSMEMTKSATPMANSVQSNNTTSAQNPQLPGTHNVMQNSMANTMGQGMGSNMVSNSQRQVHLHNQIMQSHMQQQQERQQQQNLLQQNQIQSSQQAVMQPSLEQNQLHLYFSNQLNLSSGNNELNRLQ
ncbi:mediator of RNA polymerase II transcription subunit 15a-like [Ipomoea triloba]|uniref:mediator of RNA polymerase II transcription subunit 15a-like n=1 Tax=Ipomoea triloba TaxID=35885 RepID=UPI00125D407B|nr:mediator of RNA polymerase II transcription subunit 15a-like [Ipomoea triloba]